MIHVRPMPSWSAKLISVWVKGRVDVAFNISMGSIQIEQGPRIFACKQLGVVIDIYIGSSNLKIIIFILTVSWDCGMEIVCRDIYILLNNKFTKPKITDRLLFKHYLRENSLLNKHPRGDCPRTEYCVASFPLDITNTRTMYCDK